MLRERPFLTLLVILLPVMAPEALAQGIPSAFDIADLVLMGDQPTGTYGWRVAAAGDVNGDGFQDALISDPGYVGASGGSGRATVHHGSPGGLAPAPAWSAEGGARNAFLHHASPAGDVNGDGFDDIVLVQAQAPGLENRLTLAYGSAGGLLVSPSGWEAEGHDAGHGDVNGDGFEDLAVYSFPQVRIYLGSAAGPGASAELSVSAFGSLAFQDVNGDGRSDMASAWGFRDGNRVDRVAALSVFLSVDGGFALQREGLSSFPVRRRGDREARHGRRRSLRRQPQGTVVFHGRSVSPAVTAGGDVDGDGYGDLLLMLSADPTVDVNEPSDLLLFRGSATGILKEPIPVPRWFGGSLGLGPVKGAGDLNGDGFDDALVPDYETGFTDRVLAVHLGGPGGLAGPSLVIRGPSRTFGRSSAGLGDVNGDGYGDFIFSAAETGTVFVVHGGPALQGGWRGVAGAASRRYLPSLSARPEQI